MREETVFENLERIEFLKNKQNSFLKEKCFHKNLISKLEKFTDENLSLDKKFKLSSIVCVSPETQKELQNLIDRGKFFDNDKYKLIFKKMRSCHCHSNSSELALKYPQKYRIVTGYALSEDLVWRCHTWVIQNFKNGNTRIIETTVPRIKYYGYVLNENETIKFIEEN